MPTGTRRSGAPAPEHPELPKAAIFDVDGTLLDSVGLHALAWHEAMVKFGHDVGFEEARGQIGKGGDKLIPHFLSKDAQRDHGKEMEEWRGKQFKSEYLPLVRPFSAVPDLLRRVKDAGVRIAVASSAKLKTYQTSLGFFDQAIAAPSMKAALEAWGADSNLFHQGAARESDDPDVVAATMAKPGVVLKRPVGFSRARRTARKVGRRRQSEEASTQAGGRETEEG
jgi:phosphoglycolate phosphatase-like HAD superfamily hydrolase